MAGDWIKFEKATLDKPEVFAMADALGIDPDAVIGKLVRVWAWFDTHTLDGNASRVTASLLDRVAGHHGFVTAMSSVGWAEVTDAGVHLPSFDRHNGETAKKRALGSKRQREFKERNANGNASDVTGASADASPREEKRREEVKEPETPSAPAAPAPGAGEVPKRIRAPKSDAPKTTHRFAEFWAAYPIKKGRADALKKWGQKGLDAIADQIIAHVRRMEAKDAQWKRGFIPHGSTYVNAEGWQDEPARDPDEIAAGAAADPNRRPAGWFRSSSSESELQRDIGWVMHRWERGDFGAGAAGIAERDRLVSEVRAAHQFTGA